MTVLLSDFHAAVIRLLASMRHLPSDSLTALRSGDPQVSTPVAQRILQHLVSPVQVVIDIDNAEGNSVSADRPLRLLELRRGPDLNDLDAEDVFTLTCQGKTEPVNATLDGATIAAHYVLTAFEAANDHRAMRGWQEAVQRAEASNRKYRIEWLEGYGDAPPATYPLTWFDPAGDRGFDVADADAILKLQVGEAKDFDSPTYRTRVTRLS